MHNSKMRATSLSEGSSGSLGLDVHYLTYSDTGTLSIYFCEATPGVISHSECVAPGIVVDYSADEKIVSFDINSAAKRLSCHFFTTSDPVEGKPQLAVNWVYDATRDELVLYFQAVPLVPAAMVPTYDDLVVLGVSSEEGGLLHAIYFKEASKHICTAMKP